MNRMTKAPAFFAAAAALGVALAGCASSAGESADSAAASELTASTPATSAPAAESTTSATPPASGAASDGGSGTQAATEGAWIDQVTYEANKQSYHDAGDVVLFFNASWCPTCQQAVGNLDAEGVPPGLTVVSVDYDSASDLKQEYGVTVQHTFVQVDQSGAQQAKFTGALTGEQISSKTV